MKYVTLGKSGLKVSRICFGGLTVGPLQANLDLEEGARVIARAFDKGVNFIDTAKLYKTYSYIRKAMELSKNKDIVISSKSYDYTWEGARESLQEALEELGLKKLGIFMLHEQESRLTLKGHQDALRYLVDAKKQGLIDAVGVSTHAVEVVDAAACMEDIDVIHPIVNMKGLGIMDGSINDMLRAIEKAHAAGKGIYAMKPLGGGNLMNSADEAFDFVLGNPHIHSIAVGMQNFDEVDANIARFEGRGVDPAVKERLMNRKKKLHIDFWCEGCSACTNACKQGALKIVDGKAVVDEEKCVLCGYCSAHCPNFCIKIV